jgi:hypothetical protein
MACRGELGWSKVDDIEEFDADGKRHCYVERQLECVGCGSVYDTKLFAVDKPIRELLQDPEFLARRTIYVDRGNPWR